MRKASIRATTLIAAVWLGYFGRQIFSAGVPFRRDALLVHLPMRQFIREQLLSGVLPQWYPYEGVGVPFIGQIITATFHPQTLLFLALSPAQAQKWNILAAYLFGFAGGYKLARAFGASRIGAWLGGAALAFGGYALSMSDNLPYLVGLCTLPWVGWAAARVIRHRRGRDVAMLALLWALVFLGGDAQMFACAPLVMLPALVEAPAGRVRAVGALAVAVGIAVLCCGAELIPALFVYKSSARAAGQWVIDVGTYHALHPWRLLELIVPGFLPADDRARLGQELFGEPFVWSASLFAGGITLWLACAGVARRERRTWVWGAVALLAAWMAMGARGGLYSAVTTILPPLGTFRFPEKYMALFWIALVPLVALGWDQVRATSRRWAIVAGAAALIVGGLAMAPWPSTAWASGILTTSAFLGLSGVCLLGRRTPALIPLLLVVELWRGNSGYLPLVPPALLDERANPIAQEVKEERSRGLAPPRVMDVGSPGPIASDAQKDVEDWVRESMQLMRPDSAGLTHVGVLGRSALPAYGGRPRELFGPLGVWSREVAPLLNGCFETDLTPQGVTATPLHCRARAYLSALVPVANTDAAINRLRAGLAEDEAVWEGSRALPLVKGTVEWKSWRPDAFSLRVKVAQEAGLVISEGLALGWTARLDGVPITLTPANVAVMAVVIPPGEHELSVEYRAPGLAVGLGASLLGLLIAAGLLVTRRRSEHLRSSAHMERRR